MNIETKIRTHTDTGKFHIVKGGKEIRIRFDAMHPERYSMKGRALKKCAKPACSCQDKPRNERHDLLPCGCHGLVVCCTCQIRDKACRSCGNVYVECLGDWYLVEDPHVRAKKA